MEKLPKLLPLWHDVTLRERNYREQCMDHNFMPDHGGAGIDFSLSNDVGQCEELKSSVNMANFGSDNCCVPFVLNPDVENLFDPCVERLNQQKVKVRNFCQKLSSARCNMSGITSRKFRNMILSAHEEVSCGDENPEKITVPLSILELSKLYPKKFPVPRANFLYAGGCMTKISTSCQSHILLHPVGKTLNNMALTSIKEVAKGSIRMAVKKKQMKTVKLDGGPIYGIIAESPERHHCCIRLKKRYHYAKLTSSETEDDAFNLLHTCDIGQDISSISMSNYIPGENLIALKDGMLILQSIEQKKPIWQRDEPLSHNPMVEDMWWGCGFGSHPRSVLYYDRLCFTALDIRSKRSKSMNLFSIPNPFALDKENIMVAKRFGCEDFQHLVATDVHLFIFDERYPQQPVMSWCHMLEKLPLYCSVQPYAYPDDSSVDYVVLLGTQESQDVASFHVRTQTSRVQPMSLSLPLHLSKPSDSIETINQYCQMVDEKLRKRVSMPLIGVCTIPHSTSVGFTTMCATSLGDIFCQNFEPSSDDEKTFRLGPGCIMKPLSELRPFERMLTKASHLKCEENTQQILNDKILCAHVEKKKFLKSKKKKSSRCPICNPGAATSVTSHESSDSSVCPRCGLDINFTKDLMSASKNFGVLARKSSRSPGDFDLSLLVPKTIDFSKTTDSLSQRLLNSWLEMDCHMPICNTQLEDTQDLPEDYSSQLNPTMFDIEASASQAYAYGAGASTSAISESFKITDSQVFSEAEDVVPPSQELGLGLYSSRKKRGKKQLGASTWGF